MFARVATISGVVALWLLAASFLWRTRVPANLDLPDLDPSRYFSAQQLERSLDFERFERIVWVLSILVGIGALVLLVRRAPKVAAEIGLGRIGTGIVLAMLTLTTLWFAALPFTIASSWWERRHGLARSSVGEWVLVPWVQLIGQVLFALIVVAVVLALAGRFPRRWWIPAAGAFTALALLFSFVLPYVETLGTHRLRKPELRAAVRTLEQREGVRGTPVLVDDVSHTTTQANAMSEGIGPSRRVFLWNTLLDGRFGVDEVRVVIGHELAHTARRHIWKGVAWFGIFALPIGFVIAEVTRRRGGLRDPALVPLAALASTVIGVFATPAENVISRRYEAEADWIALQSTHTPAAARRLFARFARTSLQQPNPPTWDYVMLETHPTIMQRIAMTKVWRARRR